MSQIITEPHETLSIESADNGEVKIKYYEYSETIDPKKFAEKVKKIEEELNILGYYLEARPKGHTGEGKIFGEVKESAKGETQLSVEGNDVKKVVEQFNLRAKEIRRT